MSKCGLGSAISLLGVCFRVRRTTYEQNALRLNPIYVTLVGQGHMSNFKII